MKRRRLIKELPTEKGDIKKEAEKFLSLCIQNISPRHDYSSYFNTLLPDYHIKLLCKYFDCEESDLYKKFKKYQDKHIAKSEDQPCLATKCQTGK